MAHIEKRVRNGRATYRARWRVAGGRERVKTFGRRVDAQRFLIEVEDSKLRGAYVDPAAGKMAFAEWAERWYRTTAGLKPSTRHFYRQLLDNQILPTFQSRASTAWPSANGSPASSRTARAPPGSATRTPCSA
jgi:hypothetical protein